LAFIKTFRINQQQFQLCYNEFLAEFVYIRLIFLLHFQQDIYHDFLFLIREKKCLVYRIPEEVKGFYLFCQGRVPKKIRVNEQKPACRFYHSIRVYLYFQKLKWCNKCQYTRIKIILLLSVIELRIDIPL